MKLPPLPKTPRLSGLALAAVARAARTPLLANVLVARMTASMGLDALRALRPAAQAPALRFRGGARPRGRGPGHGSDET